MALVEANWKPTARQLRQFGGICVVALPLLGWLWSGASTVVALLAGVGLLIAVVSWIYPKAVVPIFVGLMLITIPIGLVVGELAMWLIYTVVFLPIGLLFRLKSRDRLQLKIDRESASYWQPKQRPKSIASYYRQS